MTPPPTPSLRRARPTAIRARCARWVVYKAVAVANPETHERRPGSPQR